MSIAEFIQRCHEKMGYNSTNRDPCSICHQTFDTYGLLLFGTIWAHYDCMPCAICKQSKKGTVLDLNNGNYSHISCQQGRTPLAVLQHENDKLLDHLTRCNDNKKNLLTQRNQLFNQVRDINSQISSAKRKNSKL